MTTSKLESMKKVTGIGGIFFKCIDPIKMKEWYKTHLGLNTDDYGATFEWRDNENPEKKGQTQWSPFSQNTKYFECNFLSPYWLISALNLGFTVFKIVDLS